MATATTLEEAANQASDNLFTLWLASTLKAKTLTFANAISAIFDQQDPNTHPATNWAVLIASLSTNMVAGTFPVNNVTFGELQTAITYVYRICLMISVLFTDNLITAGQRTAALAAYNAAF